MFAPWRFSALPAGTEKPRGMVWSGHDHAPSRQWLCYRSRQGGGRRSAGFQVLPLYISRAGL